MMTPEVRRALTAWWQNEDTGKAVILASLPPTEPAIPDIRTFWSDDAARYRRDRDSLLRSRYYGAALPIHYPCFGSSALAGSYGCPMNPLTEDTIWPSRLWSELPEAAQLRVDWNGSWHQRMRDFVRRSADDPALITGYYALGGICDTLGSLCGEQTLLYAMMDEPERVQDCLDAVCGNWCTAAKELEACILSRQDGMGCWAGIWAPGSTFPLQEDMSFMLSDEMFREFCLPWLLRCAQTVQYPFYHLDGPPAICHLDSVLSIPNLRAIQWVPGAGKEPIGQWYDLIRRILASGKSAQVFCTPEELAPLLAAVGQNRLLVSIRELTEETLPLIEPYL